MNASILSFLAHASPLPHSHSGESTSWIPAVLALGAILAIAFAFAIARRRAKRRDSEL